jgi:2',3'-cyclic-nucleotide 2'-phosphodiesterase/3'-nucleotidase
MVPMGFIGSQNARDICHGTLRILATTDLHMQILPYDYFADRAEQTGGLVQLADQITALRADRSALTLLFDNGDFLQGNPMADTLAQAGSAKATHPMVAAFAALRYDAINLGNHEFNYGLPFLRQVLQDASCPVVCANIDWRDQTEIAQPFVILDRVIRCDDGRDHPLRIGVVGFLPPQITKWDRVKLADTITTCDIVEAAQRIVPQIKAAGADIIVALCHAGIDGVDHRPGMENAAVPLAAVPGIDAIVTGHTHEIFPDATRPATAFVDPVAGRIHGKPAVGAGFYGQALGEITLRLRRAADGWHVTDHTSAVLPAAPKAPDSAISATIKAGVQPSHNATLRQVRQPIARTLVPIHSYFARVSPDLPGHILGQALIAHAASVLPANCLPIIAAVSPVRAGGLGGPACYVAIPPGPIMRRDVCAIYPYADTAVIVRRTGAELRAWLEQAVSGYHQIVPGKADQVLLNPEFAGYVFDAFHGLTYTIDLTQPPRNDATGRIVAPQAARITDLQHNGAPVRPEQCFAVVANSYRSFGGGGFPPIPMHDVLAMSRQPVRDILTARVQRQGVVTAPIEAPWRFAPIPDTFVDFISAPDGRHHMTDRICNAGRQADGFTRYRLAL